MTERHYTHSIVSYASLKEIRRTLTENQKVSHWAYIFHDKDIDHVTGKAKPEHFHIIATFRQAQSFKSVRNMFVSEQNTFTEAIKGDIDDVFDYFTHEGIDDKFHYDKACIQYSDKDYWDKRRSNGDDEVNKNELFVDELLSDDFDELAFAKKYGRDYIKNRKSYVEFRRSFVNDDLKCFEEHELDYTRKVIEAKNATISVLNQENSGLHKSLYELRERYRCLEEDKKDLYERNKELEAIVNRLDEQNTILMNMIKEITGHVANSN